MHLELFPDEIFLFIFSYLHKLDLIYAFGKLNHRFRQLVDPYLHNIDLSQDHAVSYRQFRLLCKYILPLYSRKIRSLRLAGYHQVQLFQRYIRHLTNLQSLKITNIEMDELRNRDDDDLHHVLNINLFLNEALILPYLRTLSVDLTGNNVLKTIASSPAGSNLTHLNLIYPRSKSLSISSEYISRMCNVQYFSANFGSVKDLRILLTRLPNLRELKASMVNFDDPEVAIQMKLPVTLETLWLEFGCFHCCTNFKSLRMLLNVFKNQIHSLTLISVNVDEDLSHYETFQSLVTDFTCLETFQYCIRTIHRSDSLKHFAHVQEEPDSSCLFYTLPLLRIFDVQSERTRGGQYIGENLTSSMLFSCHRLWTLGEKIPTTFKLTNNVTLNHLQEMQIDAVFENGLSTLCQYISKVISLSPNLKSLIMETGENTKVFIDGIRNLFQNGVNKNITHLELTLDWNKDIEAHHTTFWSELTEIMPHLKTLKVNLKYSGRHEDYSLLTEIINDSKRHYSKLIHLLIGFYSKTHEDSDILEYCQKYINEMQKIGHNLFSFTLEYKCERGYCVNVWL
jgi:hypothetical protein